jgi:hypothetical protein
MCSPLLPATKNLFEICSPALVPEALLVLDLLMFELKRI